MAFAVAAAAHPGAAFNADRVQRKPAQMRDPLSQDRSQLRDSQPQALTRKLFDHAG